MRSASFECISITNHILITGFSLPMNNSRHSPNAVECYSNAIKRMYSPQICKYLNINGNYADSANIGRSVCHFNVFFSREIY